MAKRHVFDDGNPFAPELREHRVAEASKKRAAITANINVSASHKPMVPKFERLKTRLHGMDVYSRHKELINNYMLYHRGAAAEFRRDTTNDRSIRDVIRENHRFLWNDEDVPKASTSATSADESQRLWEARLAKKYYDKLFKEYCIADLSRYQTNKIAMRWRVEREVFTGKGQFICGEKRCENRENLSSWEVNFTYVEHGERKNALVKLRLCTDCSAKLNFHSKKRLIKKEKTDAKRLKRSHKKNEKKKHKKRRKHEDSSSSSSDDDEPTEDDAGDAHIAVKQEEIESATDSVDDKTKDTAESASEIWSKKVSVEEAEKTLEDEFDEFIDDLLF